MIRYTSGYICVPMEGAARPARPAADDAGQRGPQGHRLHGHRRRPRRRHHRDLGRRPGAHDPGARRPGDRRRTTSPDRATSSRCAPRRAACCAARATPRRPVDLARLAGLHPAGAICEIVNDDGSMMRAPHCRAFADEHGLVLISIADLIAWRRRTEKQVERVAEAKIPTRHGDFRAVGYESVLDRTDHVALVRGDIGDGTRRPRPRALRVPHRRRLRLAALRLRPAARRRAGAVAAEGRGVVLYMRGHEGRGIGLHAQAAGLPAAGRRAPTPSTPTSSWACPPTPATTAPAPRSSPTSASAPCGC